MSQFFAFSLKIIGLETFHPETTDGYDDYEIPAGYGMVDGNPLISNTPNMKIVSVMVSPGNIVKCPVDVDLMEFEDDQEIKVIMGGSKVVCLANIEQKKYVYFNSPLRRKYIIPKVVTGLNMAMVSAVAGYILALIFKHQQAKMGLVIVEGGSLFFFISSLIYAVYYFSNDTEAHIKLRQFLKKSLS